MLLQYAVSGKVWRAIRIWAKKPDGIGEQIVRYQLSRIRAALVRRLPPSWSLRITFPLRTSRCCPPSGRSRDITSSLLCMSPHKKADLQIASLPMVDDMGIEPTTSALRTLRSPEWSAKQPPVGGCEPVGGGILYLSPPSCAAVTSLSKSL